MSAALLHRILVPVDLGPDTPLLLAPALRLALDAGARLDLVHAHRGSDPSRPWDLRPALRDLLLRWGLADAADQADPLDQVGLVLQQVDAGPGDTTEALWRTASALAPDLLLVGTERRVGLERLLLGSRAERLARGFAVGTLFVGQGMQSLVDMDRGHLVVDRLLVPVGDAVPPQDALDAAVAFLSSVGRTQARVDLLHVGPATDDDPADDDPPSPDGSGDDHGLVQPPGATVRVRTRPGRIVASILDAATDADVIVMVTRGHDSVVDDLIGSRTERVMRSAPCPVLAVPLQI